MEKQDCHTKSICKDTVHSGDVHLQVKFLLEISRKSRGGFIMHVHFMQMWGKSILRGEKTNVKKPGEYKMEQGEQRQNNQTAKAFVHIMWRVA